MGHKQTITVTSPIAGQVASAFSSEKALELSPLKRTGCRVLDALCCLFGAY